MDLIKDELDKEFSSIGFKNQRRNLKTSSHQTGTSNKSRDEKRKALAPGKRISKTGKIYFESRRNRSDKVGSKL